MQYQCDLIYTKNNKNRGNQTETARKWAVLIIKSKNLEYFPLCERQKLIANHANFASANSNNGFDVFDIIQMPEKYS